MGSTSTTVALVVVADVVILLALKALAGGEMKLAAAEALAGLVSDEELNDDFIMPEAFDPRVAAVVSEAVKSHI